ncbi:GNAT family N-acetyltransferase, partial [Falsiroseomonas oryzae]|uniref:GNAT family N-acetyltransferase n=1 Tax=Falsiroseomonas oryzae TaxID=2766473 RepID=UPI0022EA9EBB
MDIGHATGLGTQPVALRSAVAADAEACGRIMHDAFEEISSAHDFPKDFPSREAGIALAKAMIADTQVFGVVAEAGGHVIGSNFLDERDEVRAVGPITVDPRWQDGGVGRRLMQAVLDHAEGAASVRLVQAGYHMRSLALYASLGFEVKAPLLLLDGQPRGALPAGARVRPMTEADVPACDALCATAHGISRRNELQAAVRRFGPVVLERRGRILAYLTAPELWLMNHGVAETEQDMAALLAGAAALQGRPVALLLPSRQAGLLRWCLAAGMRAVQPLTLMARGSWRVPARC